MRVNWIFTLSVLCVTAYTYDTQEVFGSLDLSGNSYQCENGMKPSITCMNPSSNNHSCSCTCTNGIMFQQPLPLSSHIGGSSASLADCQAGKNECLAREKDLMDQLDSIKDCDEAKNAWIQNHQQCMLDLKDIQDQTAESSFESSVMCPRDHAKEVKVHETRFKVWCHRFHQTVPYIGQPEDTATLAECAKLCATNPKCTNAVHGMGHRACRLREGKYSVTQEPLARDNWHSLVKV